MMFGYGGSSWPIWAMALMWIGMLIVLGVLIWGGYALMTSAARRPGHPGEPLSQDQHRETDARQILDDRLARGQIDAAEYQSLRDLITTGDDHTPAGAGTQ